MRWFGFDLVRFGLGEKLQTPANWGRRRAGDWRRAVEALALVHVLASTGYFGASSARLAVAWTRTKRTRVLYRYLQ